MMEHKSQRLVEAVSELRRRFGSDAFDVLDYWPENPSVIGFARPGEEEPCVCISVTDAADGRFHIEQHDRQVQNCLLQGVIWAVGQELSHPRPHIRRTPRSRRASPDCDAVE